MRLRKFGTYTSVNMSIFSHSTALFKSKSSKIYQEQIELYTIDFRTNSHQQNMGNVTTQLPDPKHLFNNIFTHGSMGELQTEPSRGSGEIWNEARRVIQTYISM